MSDDQNQDLEQKIEEAKKEDEVKNEESQQKDDKDAKIEELTEALARAMADLQNFRRRNEEERASFVKFANAEMLKGLIPVFDNFDRSTAHLPEELKENDWVKGVVHVHDDLVKTLEKLGVQKMKTVGEKLDPNLHDALMAGPGEKDMIIEEFEPGYLYQETAIKPAKVKVGDGTEPEKK